MVFSLFSLTCRLILLLEALVQRFTCRCGITWELIVLIDEEEILYILYIQSCNSNTKRHWRLGGVFHGATSLRTHDTKHSAQGALRRLAGISISPSRLGLRLEMSLSTTIYIYICSCCGRKHCLCSLTRTNNHACVADYYRGKAPKEWL